MAAVQRRARGTGSIEVRTDLAGRETWYGRYWSDGRLVRRRLGRKRQRGSSAGLTRGQADRGLQRLIDEAGHAPAEPTERLSLEEAGDSYIRHLELDGRKRSTLEDYRSALRIHLVPSFAGRSLEAISKQDVEAFIAAKRRDGKAPKSIRNWLSLLNAIFAYAERREWVRSNPVRLVDKPRVGDGNADVRYLDQSDLEALLRAVPEDTLGATERPLYLVAAMTGLRQGELLALRWRDVDWGAGKVRVRRSYVRGELGTPKTRRGTRSVPLADRVGGELERHFQASSWRGDEDLVFPHPVTGSYLDRSKLLKRFKAAVVRAEVGQFEDVVRANGKVERRALTRFHDLRHTFGTRMAAAGVAMRTLQEWMGHRDFKTTLIYADYSPDAGEAQLVERAFAGGGHDEGHERSETQRPLQHADAL